MGGDVGFTIREEDGKVHKMGVWTNPLPGIIDNMNLVNKDLTYIKEYIEGWYARVADYEEHKDDKKFEYRRNQFDAPHNYLAPLSYGLVVVDLKEDCILSCQDYTSFGKITSTGVHLNYGEEYTHNKAIDVGGIAMIISRGCSGREISRLKAFFDAKRIISFPKGLKSTKAFRGIMREIIDREETKISATTGKSFTLGSVQGSFTLDMSPFEIIYYPEDDGYKNMLKKIKELKFELSDDDLKMWDKWFREREEWRKEDEE